MMINYTNWPAQLTITLIDKRLVSMSIVPNHQKEVFSYIEACREAKVPISFIDADGVPHALIRGGWVESYKATTFSEVPKIKLLDDHDQVSTPQPGDDIRILTQVFLKNGKTLLAESGILGFQNLVGKLYNSVFLATPFRLGEYHHHGDHVVAYFSTAVPSCICPDKNLILQGCPSAKNDRCPFLYSTDKLDYYSV